MSLIGHVESGLVTNPGHTDQGRCESGLEAPIGAPTQGMTRAKRRLLVMSPAMETNQGQNPWIRHCCEQSGHDETNDDGNNRSL